MEARESYGLSDHDSRNSDEENDSELLFGGSNENIELVEHHGGAYESDEEVDAGESEAARWKRIREYENGGEDIEWWTGRVKLLLLAVLLLIGISIWTSVKPSALEESKDVNDKSPTTPTNTLVKENVEDGKGGKLDNDLIPSLNLCLDTKEFSSIGQVVLTLGNKDDEIVFKFTVVEAETRSARTCSPPQFAHFGVKVSDRAKIEFKSSTADHLGCIVSEEGTYVWHFFAAVVGPLTLGNTFDYTIGQIVQKDGDAARFSANQTFHGEFKTFPRKREDTKLLLVGDTGNDGRSLVLPHVKEKLDQVHAIVHVGDMSYATDEGECYASKFDDPKCRYDCKGSDPTCSGRNRCSDRIFKKWIAFFKLVGPITSRIPILTTMGNHDNDLIWFFKFRPPHFSSFIGVNEELDLSPLVREKVKLFQTSLKGRPIKEQQGHLNELLVEPFFYSVNAGPFHLVSLQSEDNGVNPYERASKESVEDVKANDDRFALHFGTRSKQMPWFEKDMKAVDRRATPWVLVFSHRPLLHTSGHHPMCQYGGDWFLCRMRETYMPLYEEYNVDMIFNGHSHHYSRSKPVRFDKASRTIISEVNTAEQSFPTYFIVGNGGYRLSHGWSSSPDWIATRNDQSYGFGMLRPTSPKSVHWEAFSSDTKSVVDQVDLTQF